VRQVTFGKNRCRFLTKGTILNVKRYKAYLFDVDGVLVDTRDWIRLSYRHTAAEYGFEASDEALSELYGRPLQTCYSTLASYMDVEALMRCHRQFQQANMHLQTLFSGTVEMLETLKARHAKTALISSRTGPSLRVTLELFDLAKWVDVVVWPEECSAHKPDPEPVFTALRMLGIDAENALVIGDTPNDIKAGQAAGTDTVGAMYGFIGEDVRHANPTHLIRHVSEVPFLTPHG
jgi:pyrophosphatase PpaX